jgi:two-component system sensor histidine kinase KdpD
VTGRGDAVHDIVRDTGVMHRGTLRLYLGAAPGTGKTFAMLTEGIRRAGRGTDVVIGVVDTHGRASTEELRRALKAVPTRSGELDLAAVLARSPAVVLVDEFAHRNPPGSATGQRYEDIERLLDAGIDVVSTLNIDELASLTDIVERVTGVRPEQTVPDATARRADEIQLVDETPQALRRRMAHGNIYPPERIDAALAAYFRPGNLAALRELALLWVADRVAEGLHRYRADHAIGDTWETRERVTVALSGRADGAALIRRAARLAGSTGAELHGVHVATAPRDSSDSAELATQRALLDSLGGSYHVVRGADRAGALVDFAHGVNATQLVLGGRRTNWLSSRLGGLGLAAGVARLSGDIGVHIVGHPASPDVQSRPAVHTRPAVGAAPRRRASVLWPSRRRAWLGAALSAALLSAMTVVLVAAGGHLNLLSAVLVYLLATVLVALAAGLAVATLTAIAATLLLNYFFTPPVHRFTISESNNALALVVFVLVAVVVSVLLDRAERRRREAARASAEAETLATVAHSVLRGEGALTSLLEQLREIFAMRAVAVIERGESWEPAADRWQVIATAGDEPPATPHQADVVAPADDRVTLLLSGRLLGADDQRVLRAVAIQAAAALRTERLAAEAELSRPLREVDRTRTALLAAVSHDLRTPLAGAKAAVSSLRDSSVAFSAEDKAELLATADESLDRLARLVANLLDMSRLQAGAMAVHSQAVAAEDVVARALDSLGPDGDRVSVSMPVDLPAVTADPGLLERVVGNLLENALRVSPPCRAPLLTASAHDQRVELRIVDGGPGLTDEAKQLAFVAFQRLGDTSNTTGVGLGLALARGLTEAMGGTLTPEDTPGGGLTMVIALRRAAAYSVPDESLPDESIPGEVA